MSGEKTAIYHVVRAHETFERAAYALWELLQMAQERNPGRPRVLYLDIEGHRNSEGGFDVDMFELQRDFVCGHMMEYLAEAVVPLFHIKNPKRQNDNIPSALITGILGSRGKGKAAH